MQNKIISCSSKIDLDNQFDVDLQVNWCDCDCNQVFKKKDKYTANATSNSLKGQGIVFKNPTATQKKKSQSICDDAGCTYCYATGTKKTTSLW